MFPCIMPWCMRPMLLLAAAGAVPVSCAMVVEAATPRPSAAVTMSTLDENAMMILRLGGRSARFPTGCMVQRANAAPVDVYARSRRTVMQNPERGTGASILVLSALVNAMNYRHAYHAGNFADVLKHTVLLALIESLQAKPTPFCYIDTHAGSGNYPLDGFEAGKTGEHRDGVARLHPAEKVPPLLQRWRAGILGSADNAQGLKRYPGSPLQVARLLRPGDSAQLCELHTEEACKLRDLFLIDPPYETQDAEYRLIEQALKPALQRWPTGIYAVWYPIKLRSQVQPFLRRLQHSDVKRVLRAELLVHPDDSPLRLNGSGMVILNAPWNLDDVLREPLRALASLLAQDQPATWKLDWLLDEARSQLNTPSPLPASRLPRAPNRR